MKKLFVCAAVLLAAVSLQAKTTKVLVGESISDALDASASGDTVLVQEGTFTGTYLIKEGVRVIGGWNAEFTAQSEFGTILDADKKGRVLDMTRDFKTLTVWSNFTITNGDSGDGGGAWLWMYGRLEDCLIENNTGNDGGGVCFDYGDSIEFVVLDRCIIRNNKANKSAGGMWMKGTAQNCIIEGNEATTTGGAAILNPGRLVNCIIRDNKAKGDFAGVRGCGHSQMINLLVYGNSTPGEVGGLSTEDALSDFINCTVVCNSEGKPMTTSGININREYEANGAVFVNNVVWGNKSNGVVATQQINGNIAAYTDSIRFNAIAGTAPASMGKVLALADENDAVYGPRFADPASFDFALTGSSCLIDKGADVFMTEALDLAGSKRKCGTVDMGAYEFQYKKVLAGTDLQTAIDEADAGTTLYVQADTFKGNFLMKEGVNLVGGWNETFTQQIEYGTVLDGDKKGRVLDMTRDFKTLTVWSNFTLTNGDSGDGGGAWLWINGRLEKCLIENNIGNDGGGVCFDYGDSIEFVVLDHCIIRNNKSNKSAGGMWMKGTAQNCIIEGNEATTTGGAAVLNPGRLVNCIIRNNKANGDFGGVRGCGHSQMINLLVYGNYTPGEVGGLSTEDALSDFINCTVVCNEEGKDKVTSGININRDYEPNGAVFVNNIVWGNKSNGKVAAQQINDNISAYTTDIHFNAIAGTAPASMGKVIALAAENDAADGPLFADPANFNFALTFASPLFEAGINMHNPLSKDLANEARVKGDSIDMGAFELNAYTIKVVDFEHAVAILNGDTLKAGTFWVGDQYTNTMTITAEKGYIIDGVEFNGVTLEGEENVYTIPAVSKNSTLQIYTDEDPSMGVDEITNKEIKKAYKVVRNGQIIVIREGIEYNVLGGLNQ